MNAEQEERFRLVAAAHMRTLRRTGYGLSGDWHTADDLAQTTLVKLYSAWPLRDVGALEGWLRRTLVRSWVDETRRPWWRRERSVDGLPDQAARDDSNGEGAADLVGWLDWLPPRQRACLVLRFLDDCSVEQTAEVLQCSVGTVKSQTSRGLASLRARINASSAYEPTTERTAR